MVASGQPADLTIINSCAVTRQAEAKTRAVITAARRCSPYGKIAVVGCYAQYRPEELRRLGTVELIVGNEAKFDLERRVRALEEPGVASTTPEAAPASVFAPSGSIASGLLTRANLKIQDGCDFGCAYCIIPLLRGPSQSRPADDVITEACQLEAEGHHEIVLTGINLGSYRNRELDLTGLLLRLLNTTRTARIRLSSIEPNLVGAELLRLMLNEPRICRHLHLPLQHAADRMLRLMGRRYGAAEYQALTEKIKAIMPDCCLGADVLVGFPGETEADFAELLAYVRVIPINYLHVFRYSPRPGTAATRLRDTVTSTQKKRRVELLRQVSSQKRREFNATFIGQTVSVLFEKSCGPDCYRGWSGNYLSVTGKSASNRINQIGAVRLTRIRGNDLEGDCCSD